MQPLGLNEIRERFLQFFESKDHLRMKSSSLIPKNDKSLLLINSGMAPLKAYFTGQEVPPNKRVTTCQKCIRTGDIENVGKTDRHGTFFEMLGDFSFGDYFKEEIIPWAYEFCTKVMEIPAKKLYASVYLEDDEAYEIWNKKVGLEPKHIVRLGKDDNFWEVGTGPCGPCSEIYYDRGREYGCDNPNCAPGCECERFLEIWNLVFTQFNKEEDGSYSKLKFPNIDTGMGLERIAQVMQGVKSIFDVDTIKAIRDKVCEISGKKYLDNHEDDVSIRIITDHARAIVFMLSDGVTPSNEGRGYVLRRLLRRAVRRGKLLGIEDMFLEKVCKVAIQTSKGAYPELLENELSTMKIINYEEQRFNENLKQGKKKILDLVQNAKSQMNKILSGSEAFKLYDTYGFPPDLLKEMLEEQGMDFDQTEFEKEMESQRETARVNRGLNTFMGSDDTVYTQIDKNITSNFIGYDKGYFEGAIVKAIAKDNELIETAYDGDEISIILDKTIFYPEMGGQNGDIGTIKTNNAVINIYDTVKVVGNKIASLGKVSEGSIKLGDVVTLETGKEKRKNTSRNHTATHLLHKALKQVLGDHVQQQGSLVTDMKLRFDFTNFEAMTTEQIVEVETIVNNKILECLQVSTTEENIEQAKKRGAMALFSEKYDDLVRVVQIDDYSIELCGGTHVNNTSEIGIFKIIYETSVASGIRRIEAITGKSAFMYYKQLNNRVNNIQSILKATPDNIIAKIEHFMNESKGLRSEIEKLNSSIYNDMIDKTLNNVVTINGINVLVTNFKNVDMQNLKVLSDKVKDKLSNYFIVLFSSKDDKVNILVSSSDEAIQKGLKAGDVIKKVAPVVGGSGGGKPNSAQAGGKDKEKIDEAIKETNNIIKNILG